MWELRVAMTRLDVGALGGRMGSNILCKRSIHCESVDINEAAHGTLRCLPFVFRHSTWRWTDTDDTPFHFVRFGS
jgi:hypothetical protein